MTKRLEEAFAKASKLPEKEQDSLAAWLMEELEDEHAWEEKLQSPTMCWLGSLRRHSLSTEPGRPAPWTQMVCEITDDGAFQKSVSGTPSPHPRVSTTGI
jgi:hypothetical protein